MPVPAIIIHSPPTSASRRRRGSIAEKVAKVAGAIDGAITRRSTRPSTLSHENRPYLRSVSTPDAVRPRGQANPGEWGSSTTLTSTLPFQFPPKDEYARPFPRRGRHTICYERAPLSAPILPPLRLGTPPNEFAAGVQSALLEGEDWGRLDFLNLAEHLALGTPKKKRVGNSGSLGSPPCTLGGSLGGSLSGSPRSVRSSPSSGHSARGKARRRKTDAGVYPATAIPPVPPLPADLAPSRSASPAPVFSRSPSPAPVPTEDTPAPRGPPVTPAGGAPRGRLRINTTLANASYKLRDVTDSPASFKSCPAETPTPSPTHDTFSRPRTASEICRNGAMRPYSELTASPFELESPGKRSPGLIESPDITESLAHVESPTRAAPSPRVNSLATKFPVVDSPVTDPPNIESPVSLQPPSIVESPVVEYLSSPLEFPLPDRDLPRRSDTPPAYLVPRQRPILAPRANTLYSPRPSTVFNHLIRRKPVRRNIFDILHNGGNHPHSNIIEGILENIPPGQLGHLRKVSTDMRNWVDSFLCFHLTIESYGAPDASHIKISVSRFEGRKETEIKSMRIFSNEESFETIPIIVSQDILARTRCVELRGPLGRTDVSQLAERLLNLQTVRLCENGLGLFPDSSPFAAENVVATLNHDPLQARLQGRSLDLHRQLPEGVKRLFLNVRFDTYPGERTRPFSYPSTLKEVTVRFVGHLPPNINNGLLRVRPFDLISQQIGPLCSNIKYNFIDSINFAALWTLPAPTPETLGVLERTRRLVRLGTRKKSNPKLIQHGVDVATTKHTCSLMHGPMYNVNRHSAENALLALLRDAVAGGDKKPRLGEHVVAAVLSRISFLSLDEYRRKVAPEQFVMETIE